MFNMGDKVIYNSKKSSLYNKEGVVVRRNFYHGVDEYKYTVDFVLKKITRISLIRERDLALVAREPDWEI